MLRKSSLTLLSLYNFAMVAVLHDAPRAAAPQTVAAWLESLAPTYQPSVRETFATAFDLARERCGDARLPDGEGVLDRAVGAATIIASLHLDPDSIVAALLSGLPAVDAFDADDIQARFGADVATLVGGVARMESIRARVNTAGGHDAALQAENLFAHHRKFVVLQKRCEWIVRFEIAMHPGEHRRDG